MREALIMTQSHHLTRSVIHRFSSRTPSIYDRGIGGQGAYRGSPKQLVALGVHGFGIRRAGVPKAKRRRILSGDTLILNSQFSTLSRFSFRAEQSYLLFRFPIYRGDFFVATFEVIESFIASLLHRGAAGEAQIGKNIHL